MKKLINFIRDKHQILFKILLFITATGLIVFLFPREGKFKYEFSKGKPWPHEDLIAPFDYPIYKSQEQINAEKKTVLIQKSIYFFKNENIKTESIQTYNTNFEIAWNKFLNEKTKLDLSRSKYQIFNLGKGILERLYDTGIIELHSSIENKPKTFEVSILVNNVAKDYRLNQLYTIQEAFVYAKNQLSGLDDETQSFLLGLIEELIKHNVSYDDATNELILKQELSHISPTSGMVQRGERVVAKGEILNNQKFQLVESLRLEYENQTGSSSKMYLILVGQIILVSLMILSLALFLASFRKGIIHSDIKISFLLFLILLFVFGAKMALDVNNLNVYLVPFCMLPLVVRTFFDIRVSLFTYLVAILIIGFFVPNPYEFIILEMITGILALFGILNLRNRSQLFLSSLIIFTVYSVTYIGIGLIQEGSFEDTNWMFLGWFFGSAMLTLFTYPMIYIFEKTFGFVSDVSLMELADTNNKLLRKLNAKAPGTFQHSLQVSNLAEEAIRAIGGNTLLVRTGSLYHDIGKMNMPNYFIENQNTDYNPHEDLSPEESASIIIGHVINGIEIARRNKLPDIIIDFIRTHHGTTKTQYFLYQYKKENPDEKIDESMFQYPGPIPYSKETAVLMMADSVEAASRSLKTYDGESIGNLVNTIIDSQVAEEQFILSDITYKDVTLIKKMFKKKLMSMYHVRVEYPE
ncbi:MAG: HDIG domain-containing protein [Flavobacteriales bacterium]|nr:HDIG domain-containing protein [Flavobacteriales bacterium]